MTKNCRNCKFAEWHRNASGAKRFGNWAACTAPVPNFDQLPASVRASWRFRELEAILTGPRAVASNTSAPLDCPTWEKD
jgi:hypothetical protein